MKQLDLNNQTDLLQAIKDGDARAFHLVHREYYRSLIYYAYKMVQLMPAAEDVVSDSFCKLFLSRARMENMGHVREFLYRVTRNASIDLIRSKVKEKAVQKDLLHLAGGEGDNKESFAVVEAETLDKIYREIENLPEKSRQVFKLYFFEEKSTTEISEALQIHPQTVLNHKSSAVKNLRSKLLLQKLMTLLVVGLSALFHG
jgi:RNA polymerase sigma-70 factor (family 1)